jgi:hypothetical protein
MHSQLDLNQVNVVANSLPKFYVSQATFLCFRRYDIILLKDIARLIAR